MVWRAVPDLPLVLVSLIYGFGAVFMFLASGLYHGLRREGDDTSIRRKLDHIGIFFMIAGTYTPLCYVYLVGELRWDLIIAQWALVIAGFFQSIFYIKAPRVVTTIIYLLMGWMAVIPLKQLTAKMSTLSLMLLVSGGLAYTAGAIFYMLKKPNLKPGFFGFHELFHVCVLIGALLHYLVIFDVIT